MSIFHVKTTEMESTNNTALKVVRSTDSGHYQIYMASQKKLYTYREWQICGLQAYCLWSDEKHDYPFIWQMKPSRIYG